MDIDEKLKQNIEKICQSLPGECIGASKAQRLLECGYNQAIHTLEYGASVGLLRQDQEKQYQYWVRG